MTHIHQRDNTSRGLVQQFSTQDQAVQATLKGVPVAVVNLPPTEESLISVARDLAEQLGHSVFSEIDEIKPDLNAEGVHNSIRLSLKRHELHTDGNFQAGDQPSHFLLQAARIDPAGGGASTFLPTQSILKQLPDSFRKALEERSVLFRHKNRDGSVKNFITTVLNRRADGSYAIRYANDPQVRITPLSSNDWELERALNLVGRYVSEATPVTYAANVGDVILVCNDLVFHGREAISEYGGERLMRRIYIGCSRFFTGL